MSVDRGSAHSELASRDAPGFLRLARQGWATNSALRPGTTSVSVGAGGFSTDALPLLPTKSAGDGVDERSADGIGRRRGVSPHEEHVERGRDRSDEGAS